MSDFPVHGLYILDPTGEVPVAETDVAKWGEWFGDFSHRLVAKTTVSSPDPDFRDVKVSTVFLGIDSSLFNKVPILWETLVFRNGEAAEREQCAGTREQAVAMHARMCAEVFGVNNPLVALASPS